MNDKAQPELSENEQIAERRKKLNEWRDATTAYPNEFRPDISAEVCHERYDAMSKEELEEKNIVVNVAGRIVTRRIMGKASFATLQDGNTKIQVYLTRDSLTEEFYNTTKHWDLGDIIGVTGKLFQTKTGELTVWADSTILLTKALRPLPDKFHGLSDNETRARQRYLDLIANAETRQRFQTRSRLISALRNHLEQHGFMEVETPMLHPLIGGAAAKPFATHHNALDMSLFMRIAPELYLKRLLVGGFNRVYELNRNFRNEGLSTRHNPEFTMVEFYQAYADYKMLMDFTEVMLRDLAEKVLGRSTIHFNGTEIDLTQPFTRMSIKQAILHYGDNIDAKVLEDRGTAAKLAKQHGIEVADIWGLGKIQTELFEAIAESKLLQPTFITEFPAEVSPLARPNNDDAFITDRFELYVGGQEIANGFSELNDPEDQAERFKAQLAAKEAGEEETMSFDQDYITALEHGLPPAAGEGIGIDRLTMLFTDSASIRDVILFPQLRNKD